MTLTADLVLTSDLNCVGTGTDGLVVGADGITIDLGGFTITGDDTPGLTGIRVRGFQNVTLTNGTVRDFDHGVVVETDGLSKRTSRVVVFNVEASSNLNFGFLTTSGPGDPPSSATLIHNTASNNGKNGIHFDKGFFTTVNNMSRSNADAGIGVGGAQGALFGDKVFRNATSGLAVFDVVDAGVPLDAAITAVLVIAYENGGSGFFISDGAEATLTKNVAFRNGVFGFECSEDVTIRDAGGNKAFGNGAGPQSAECGLDL